VEEPFFLDEHDTQAQTPPGKRNEAESGSAEDDQEKYINDAVKPVDDVYDSNAVKPNYELLCLRKNGVLDYMKMMSMVDNQQG